MATTAGGTPYVESSDLVANYPAVSLALAEKIDTKANTSALDAKANLTGATFTGTVGGSGSVGTSLNDNRVFISLSSVTGANTTFLRSLAVRHTAGSDWTGLGWRIRHAVDSTNMAQIEFNPLGNQQGISITGSRVWVPSILQSTGVYTTTTTAGSNVNIETAAGADQAILKRSTSSIKYKTDVETLDTEYADKALQLRPVWFRSTCEGDVELHPDWSYYGLIAEEVAQIEPRLVHWGGDDPDNPQPEGVQYDRLVVHLLSIVQRQQQQLSELTERIGEKA